MGMFDTVHVRCPRCGRENSQQTKSGPCLLNDYRLEDAPQEVLGGIARETFACEDCSIAYRVRLIAVVEPMQWSDVP